MKKTFLTACLALCLGVIAPPAHAIVIGLTPSAASVGVGGSVVLDLTVSGLANGAAPSLGAFDIDIAFDGSALGLTDAVFGAALGDLSLFEAIASVDASTPGIVNLFEVSLLEADATSCILCFGPYLDEIQSDSFVLASLSFMALAPGLSTVAPSSVLLGDGFGDALAVAGISGSAVTVTGAVSVPEPGTLLLYGIGLIGLIVVRSQIPGLWRQGRAAG